MTLLTDPSAATTAQRLSVVLKKLAYAFLLVLAVGGLGIELLGVASGGISVGVVPGLVVLTALVPFGHRAPVRYGSVAAGVLVADTVALVLTGSDTYLAPLGGFLPTETLVGLLFVLYLCWRSPAGSAVVVTGALVASAVLSVLLRGVLGGFLDVDALPRTAVLGGIQLFFAVGTGLYLRSRRTYASDNPTLRLLISQLPAIVVLGSMLMLQTLSLSGPPLSAAIVLIASVTTSVLAVFGPARPSEATVLGAVTLVLMAALLWLLPYSAATSQPIPLAVVMAGLVLTTNVSRLAEVGDAARAVGAEVAAVVFALVVIPNETSFLELFGQIFLGGVAFGFAVGFGVYFRMRENSRRQMVEAAAASAQHNERMALARELHDIVAHHVTGIVVQAQAASMVARTSPETASEALDTITDSGTEALAAMRRLVASMRGTEPAGATPATERATVDLEADLAELVNGTGDGTSDQRAPRVDLAVDLDRTVPQEVARSALRLVQESVTNSEKHALDVSVIQVSVTARNEVLRVRVTDDGSGTRAVPPGGSGGYGLVGMRERVELLGGRFSAGRGEHIGWRVEAWLPMSAPEEEDESR